MVTQFPRGCYHKKNTRKHDLNKQEDDEWTTHNNAKQKVQEIISKRHFYTLTCF